MTQDGRWEVDACPWLELDAASRTEALVAARAAVAVILNVEPDWFDAGTERSQAEGGSSVSEVGRQLGMI